MATAIETVHPLGPLPARPRLSCRHIIFTNGPSLTGKTTIAKHVAERLGIRLLATHEHGSVRKNGALDSQKRLDRYQRLMPRARAAVATGQSVVLDGSFIDYARRSWVYALGRAFDARVIAIRAYCDDLALIRARARQRAGDPNGKDRDVGVDAYLLTRKAVRANPLEDDAEFWELGVQVVEFHTGATPFVLCTPDAHTDTLLLASTLEESGLLASPPAVASRLPGTRAGV